MDVLDEILGSLRLTGGIVIDGEFSGDFCVHAEFTPKHCEPFFPLPDRLLAYHYVRSGKMIIDVDGQPPVTLGRGSIAILPRNDGHVLASRPGLTPVDKAEVRWMTEGGIHRVASGTGGEKAEVWCGFLGTAKTGVHPLLDALPPLLVLDSAGGEAEWLDSSMRFLAEQSPTPEIVAKLAELFLSQAIREYVDQLPPDSAGWLRGLADPAVSKALSIIHRRYAEDLDVESLAREAGVSRTVLGERFVELLGEPPMRYCARWRMRIASNLLREGKQNTASIAYAVGFDSDAAFNRAFKREFGEPPATWRRRTEAEAAAVAAALRSPNQLPDQQVRYCTAKDGTRLAYSIMGDGPPLVKTANWLNHIEFDWKSPLWKHWLAELTNGRELVRYDERGNGMSDWDTPELSLDAFVDDLESVVEAAGVEQFDLLGVSQGAAVAIAYSLRNPNRVRRMILYGGYARGWAVRLQGDDLQRREAMVTLARTGWGSDNPAYRQLFTSTYIPGATAEQMDWFNELQRRSASPENAVRLQRVLSKLDVSDLLAKVTVPTLVIHARGDQAVPFSCGEELARGIPGARLLALEGRNHILLANEPAWPEFAAAMRDFLGPVAATAATLSEPSAAPPVSDEIATCTSADGTKIAYASCGDGFPVVKAPTAVTHLEHDRSNPVYGHWIRELSRSNRLVRADMRGFGMSQWDPAEFTMDSLVADLAAVVDASGIDRFDLVGLTHGAAIAIAYAGRNPERVRKLVLLNSFAAGWAIRADPAEIAWRKGLVELNRQRWRRENVIIGERFMSLYFPSAAAEIVEWHQGHLEEMCTAETVERMLEWGSTIDVRSELANVRAETLVLHAVHDGNAPIEVGRQLAGGIPGARFVEIDSANHVTLANEPAWPAVVREIRAFLAADPVPAPAQIAPMPSVV